MTKRANKGERLGSSQPDALEKLRSTKPVVHVVPFQLQQIYGSCFCSWCVGFAAMYLAILCPLVMLLRLEPGKLWMNPLPLTCTLYKRTNEIFHVDARSTSITRMF